MTTQETVPTTADLSKYIDFKFFGDRPHIRGQRIWVSMIATNAQSNQWSVATLAHEFSLTEEEVLAALLYYREHKDEIDLQDSEEQKRFDETYRAQGKPSEK
jgi:uncharacterized protein (DUF433 family)